MPTALWPSLALLALVVAGGCSGVRLRDVSKEPAPSDVKVEASSTISGRAVVASLTVEHELPSEDDPWFEERARLAGLVAARELSRRLVEAGVFEEATPLEVSGEPRPTDTALTLCEEIVAAPRFEVGPRRLLTAVSAIVLPLLTVTIPLGAIYVEHDEPVRARYSLVCRDARGDVVARFETVAEVAIEEQVLGCNEDVGDARAWLAHASALRLARDRGLGVLVERLSRGGPR